MRYNSYIELSQKSLAKNINYLKQIIGPNVTFVSVIKGNAYGHGITEFVPLAEKCGIDFFAVFDVFEAQQAYSVKREGTHVMIMGMIHGEDLPWVLSNNCSFFVSDLNTLQNVVSIAQELKKRAFIHIELETGLHRTGFEEDELPSLVEIINRNSDNISVEGLCTHLAGAESISNYVRIHSQMGIYERVKEWMKKQGILPTYFHVACSAAALMYPESRMNMVRIGIAQYGYWPSKETKIHKLLSDTSQYKRNHLHSMLAWKSTVSGVKYVSPGEFIGYGNMFQTTKQTKIATIPVGYYHGYRRSLSNVGHVLIRGKKAPIIGLVNMSIMITDVTAIPEVTRGDEVVLIGKQGTQKISVSSFSEQLNLVNYELLSRLPMQIPRYVTH
ncbi:MAG: alanine racemase [Candidatus Thermoplasmatota archaeon]|nr:alanine racemase [Candidatus Thermoplasmatota archaeon]